MNITCAGETLTLCADRAVFWPRRRTVLIADPHFGKDEIFRSSGLAIPEGMVAHDLQRISTLLSQHDATRLVVLGDFYHGSPKRSERFAEAFAVWLAAHPHLSIDVVAGNHDRHGGSGTWSEHLSWRQEPFIDGPFSLAHHLRETETAYTLSGHIHPVLRLYSRSGDRARVPVFWFAERYAVLPAFGSFTGGAEIAAAPGDRVFAIADSTVIPLAAA
jgi:DNA ligase-associated metallophosphoesterase